MNDKELQTYGSKEETRESILGAVNLKLLRMQIEISSLILKIEGCDRSSHPSIEWLGVAKDSIEKASFVIESDIGESDETC